MRYFLLMSIFLLNQTTWAISLPWSKSSNGDDHCSSAKEYITTLEYLKSQKHLDLPLNKARTIALKVAGGCNGAAKRFITSYETLLKAEAGGTNAVHISQVLANKKDIYHKTFLETFKLVYLQKNLDMDMQSSLKIASALSFEYASDLKFVLKDFKEMVKFCLNENKVGLSKSNCGMLISRVIKHTETHGRSVADAFKKVYEFARESEHLKLPVGESLSLAEQVVAISPKAAENFIYAYKYGVKEKGLAMTAEDSLNFAWALTKKTLPPADWKKSTERFPANK